MKKFIFISILILLYITKGATAQGTVVQISDTTVFQELPDSLKKDIEINISKLLESDTISGSLSYRKNNNNHRYTYKLFLKGNQLQGYYTHYRDCTGCMFPEVSAGIKAIALYCCKDPSHKPNETAKTKNEILEIKKKKHCSKVGICIID